ncbi:glycosyltransferase family 4 protein [Motiliproteus coralliicola]|nr:glycosyltransferase family 4 protein [Motiliproteus coralliicola]
MALRAAGGRSVGLNFLRACAEGAASHHTIDALVPSGAGYEALASENLRIHPVPPWLNRIWFRPYADKIWIPAKVRELEADVLFSMGNIATPFDGPQLVLFHLPYAIYPDRHSWGKIGWKDRLILNLMIANVSHTIGGASKVAVQTETAKRRLMQQFGLPSQQLEVIPNAISLPSEAGVEGQCGSEFDYLRLTEGRTLLCLSRYYTHKNLEVFLPLARLIREQRLSIRILLTLGAEEMPACRQLLNQLAAEQLDEIVVNIGPVNMQRVPALYRAVDGMILPTLLESFSGTYIEAMYYGVPVLTSDRDFARDVCADNASYFDPVDPQSILATIEQLFSDSERLERCRTGGRARVASMPSWPQVAECYISQLEKLHEAG